MRRVAPRYPLLVGGLLLVTTVLCVTAAMAKPRLRIYTVQHGESCWSIAERFFGKGEHYRIIHRYNRLGPLPHLLVAGQKLKLPLSAAQPAAHIRWLQRDVTARPPKVAAWQRAKKDMGLWRLYKVATGPFSSAGITFEDDSRLRMRQRGLLVIYAGSAQKARLSNRKVAVRVEEGNVRGGLAALDRGALRVQTPSAEIMLRSTRAQIEVDRQKTSIVSIYDGHSEVAAQGSKVRVKGGFGTFVKQGKKPEKPRPLPQAPGWTSHKPLFAVVGVGQKASLEARWRPVKQAARYRVELAADRAFRYPIVDAVVGAGITRFVAKRLAAGRYYARVATIDRFKLEGAPSALRELRVVTLRASRRLEKRGQSFEAVGLVRVGLPGDKWQVSIDGGPFAKGELVLSKPGLHRLRFRRDKSEPTSVVSVRVLNVSATMTARPIASDGAALGKPKSERLRVQLAIRDEKGRPAALPSVALTQRVSSGDPPAKKERRVVLRAKSAGLFEATVERRLDQALLLQASWPLSRLARLELPAVVKPTRRKTPKRPIGKRAPWQAPLLAAGYSGPWSLNSVGLPARDTRARTRIGTSAHLSRWDGADVQRGRRHTALRLAVDGELALFRGRLGIDFNLPWFQAELDPDRAGQRELGNFRLGARFASALPWHLEVAFGFGVQLPLHDNAAVWKASSFEPGIILQWKRRWFAFNSNHVLSVQTDGRATRALLMQTAAVSGRLLSWLQLGLELVVANSLVTPDDSRSDVTQAPDPATARRSMASRWAVAFACLGGSRRCERRSQLASTQTAAV
jgi:hypothetical protein